jgi:chromate reductase
MEPIRILGLSGSLRAGSHNTSLLRAAAQSLPAGVELAIYDGLRDLPHYDADLDAAGTSPAVAALRAAVAEADGVLIATPEFNGSIPGALKNALDWASRPYGAGALRAKPVAVVGASTGQFGAAWAQADVRRVLGVIGADVIDGELPVGRAADAFAPDGHLAEAGQRATLAELVGVLAARAGAREAEAA